MIPTEPSLRRRIVAALGLGLLPVALWQGKRLRDRIPVVGAGAGATTGLIDGQEPPVRLITFGESPVAGWGVPTQTDAVTCRLAARLAARDRRAVAWQAIGRDGLTVTQALSLPLTSAARADVLVLALGVNDVLSLTPASRWQRDLDRLITRLQRHLQPVTTLLAGVPPMQRFPTFPRPLATLAGLRAAVLDDIAATVGRDHHATHVPIPLGDERHFCEDGVHPSPLGHDLWARELLAHIPAATGTAAAPA